MAFSPNLDRTVNPDTATSNGVLGDYGRPPETTIRTRDTPKTVVFFGGSEVDFYHERTVTDLVNSYGRQS